MNREALVEQIRTKQSFLCVGLDTDPTKLPKHLPANYEGVVAFNKSIIDATKDYCVSYKINTAFYEAMGIKGWQAMEETVHYIPSTHFKIADAKRGDIGNTSSQYARAFFETMSFDAITVAPYMGEDSIRPFLEYENKVTIVLGLTSNKGSNNFQRLELSGGKQQLYQQVLTTVASWGSAQNLMFVIGATHPADFRMVRDILPDHFLLVPGVGAQGGSVEDICLHGRNHDVGLLINVSRGIIYAHDTESYSTAAANEAANYHEQMRRFC